MGLHGPDAREGSSAAISSMLSGRGPSGRGQVEHLEGVDRLVLGQHVGQREVAEHAAAQRMDEEERRLRPVVLPQRDEDRAGQLPAAVDQLGEHRHGATGQQARHRHLGAGGLLDPQHDAERRDGMPAEIAESVRETDPVQPQLLLPQSGDQPFGLGDRLDERAGAGIARPGSGRALRSTFPLGVSGKRIEQHEGRRDHVVRHLGRHVRSQQGRRRRLRFGAGPGRRRAAGRRVRPVAARRSPGHSRVPAEHGLDLTELDPVAPQLDLVVRPAKELQPAVGTPAHGVAGAESRAPGLPQGEATKLPAVISGRRQ